MQRTHGELHYDPDNCFGCKLISLQFPAATGPAFKPHFNYAVGKFVRTDKEFRDELKRCAERNSIATGTDHDYQPRYGSDLQPIREADQVLEDRARNLTALANNKPLVVTGDAPTND